MLQFLKFFNRELIDWDNKSSFLPTYLQHSQKEFLYSILFHFVAEYPDYTCYLFVSWAFCEFLKGQIFDEGRRIEWRKILIWATFHTHRNRGNFQWCWHAADILSSFTINHIFECDGKTSFFNNSAYSLSWMSSSLFQCALF